MPKTIVITLNNSGNDPGPYTLSLIDSLNNVTMWSGNPVTKAQLIAGYQMTVPDNIVKVKVQSNRCVTFVELIIPTTKCPCRYYNFCGVKGELTTFTFYKCGESTTTSITVGDICVSQCIDTYKPITVSGPGTYSDTNTCCSSSSGTTTTTTILPTTTTTTTTINCCQGGFVGLPLPGEPAIVSNGVSISSSYTVPTTPLSLGRFNPNVTLCAACYPCTTYPTVIFTAAPVSSSNPFGPTQPWDYILNFSQPITSINIRLLNLSSTEYYDTNTQTYIDAKIEGVEFKTNVGNPTVSLCQGCTVNVQGNKVYCDSAMIGHTLVKNGSGIFKISSATPFSTLRISDVTIFTNSSICYYCGPDYPCGISFDMCGQVVK